MNFHFFQSVNFSSSHGNLSFEKHGFFRKKIKFLFFFLKHNHFGKKMFAEPQSLFERASFPYFLFFNFPISKSDMWRYRLDNAYTHFRALDRFCFLGPNSQVRSRFARALETFEWSRNGKLVFSSSFDMALERHLVYDLHAVSPSRSFHLQANQQPSIIER